MKPITAAFLTLTAILFPLLSTAQAQSGAAVAPYPAWQHSGVLTILTTPDGANLPAGVVVEGFPLLVRLHKDWFDFKQAKPDGADVRFADHAGKALAYQIEEWDAANGSASIWVRIPRITGGVFVSAFPSQWPNHYPKGVGNRGESPCISLRGG